MLNSFVGGMPKKKDNNNTSGGRMCKTNVTLVTLDEHKVFDEQKLNHTRSMLGQQIAMDKSDSSKR